MGCLAGSAGRACDSSSQDREFKPHVGHTDYYKEIKLKEILGNNWIFFRFCISVWLDNWIFFRFCISALLGGIRTVVGLGLTFPNTKVQTGLS